MSDPNTEDVLVGMPKSADSTLQSGRESPSITSAPPARRKSTLTIFGLCFVRSWPTVSNSQLTMRIGPCPLYAAVGQAEAHKADPANRTGCKEAPAAPKIRATPIRALPAHHLSEHDDDAIAEQLQRLAPGYIHVPVLDSTGIEGNWA